VHQFGIFYEYLQREEHYKRERERFSRYCDDIRNLVEMVENAACEKAAVGEEV